MKNQQLNTNGSCNQGICHKNTSVEGVLESESIIDYKQVSQLVDMHLVGSSPAVFIEKLHLIVGALETISEDLRNEIKMDIENFHNDSGRHFITT